MLAAILAAFKNTSGPVTALPILINIPPWVILVIS